MIFFTISLLISHFIYAWSDANYFRPVTQIKNVFPVFFPLTADSLMKKMHLIDEEKVKQNEKLNINSDSNTVNYPLKPIVSDNKSIKKNILYLVIDTWRKGYMNTSAT